MVLDPEIAAEVTVDAESPRDLPLADFRIQAEAAMLDGQGPGPAMDVEDIVTPTSAATPCTLYRPAGSDGPAPALLFIHGGGWVIGSRASHDPMCRVLADLAGVVVVSPEYRRAPEHRFPTAVDDITEVRRWLVTEAGSLGLDPASIAVGGDSAGGNLAAVTARRARDEGCSLALQLLIYPVADARRKTRSYESFAEGYGLSADDMEWFWSQYLGPDGDGLDPDASPLLAADLQGLPPSIIVTAELDVLRDEGEAYAERLAQAGVVTTRLRALGMPHAFLNYFGRSEVVRRYYRIIAMALRDAIGARAT